MTTPELVALCRVALAEGLRDFGEYAFFDKGPDEVLNVNDLVLKFKEAGVVVSIEAFAELLTIERFGEKLASAILLDLQDWDELWEDNEDFLGSFL